MNPLLLPTVAVQGIWVRSRTERIPPAAGPIRCTTAPQPDEREPIRLGVLGESTAAGCGVETHDQGFPGAAARILAERSGRPVSWSVMGQNAATARRIRYRLLPQFEGNFDVVVLLAGVNDVLARRPAQDWYDDLSAILDDLEPRAGQVVIAGIPPFDAFPALPRTLGRYLAERATALDRESRRVCASRPNAFWVDAKSLLPVGPEFFSRDRFHPSALGYQRWASAVAEHIGP